MAKKCNGRRWLRFVGGIVVASCLAIGAWPERVQAAPSLHLPTTRLEIGELTAGEVAEVEFPLANTGSERLQILNVRVNCSCTTTSYPDTLNPGEKGTLKVKLASNPLWDGPVEKQITVFSNDPGQPAVKMQVVAQMRPLFRFAPGNPLSVNYKDGETIQQVFTVTSAAELPAEIVGVVPAGPGVEARLLSGGSGEKPGVWRVEVTVRPPDGGGDFSRSVTLQTSHPRVRTITLGLNGLSESQISVSPDRIYLTGISAGAGAGLLRKVMVFKRGGPFRVLEVKSDTPALQAQLRETAAAHYHEIELRYVGGWSKGPQSGKIVITTNDPGTPKLEIPYQATVE